MQVDEDLLWLHAVRDIELDVALTFFPIDKRVSIVELGSGTGYMLEKIREKYPNVRGVEVTGSVYDFSDSGISIYDGETLPFESESVDVVFSSHVLEHIVDVDDYLVELARVIKPGGVSIHILPSPLWRFLTSVMHYPALVKMLYAMVMSKGYQNVRLETKQRRKFELLKFMFFASRHGEYGNVITENYFFSRLRWGKVFAKSPLSLVESKGVGLVYWGRDFLRLFWPIRSRQYLARIIGSASIIYVMRKPL